MNHPLIKLETRTLLTGLRWETYQALWLDLMEKNYLSNNE
jgi:hypothetical protein